jgi:uncharacterized protein
LAAHAVRLDTPRDIVRLALALFLLASPAWAIRFPEKPPAQEYCVDGAGLIGTEQRQAINATAAALQREQDVPMLVVTIRSLAEVDAAGSTLESYATALFNHWGIGSQARNNGVLLLVSLGDRKARIELGAGWGSEHDAQAASVMEQLILPAFRRGDYAAGIADGIRGLDAMVRGLNLPPPARPWWHVPAMILAGVVVIAAIVNLIRAPRTGWAWITAASMGTLLLGAWRSRGRHSGSQGRGSFRGGSSRGGGATGSW